MKKNTKNQIDDRYFRTENFYLACFLFTKGLEIVGINNIEGSNRKQFVFRDSLAREKWVDDYHFAKINSPELVLDIRKFIYAIKMLKERLST